MNPSDPPATPDALQFDRAVPAGHARPRSGTVDCSACGSRLTTEYWDAGGAPVCAGCRMQLQRHMLPVREWGAVGRAALFGVPAAVAGGALYYGVAALTGLEIGIVAIVCGFMVGWAVRRSAQGRGGLRLQLLAVGLTYFSVALAYLPFAVQGALQASEETAAVQAPAPGEEGEAPPVTLPDEAAALAAAPAAGTGAREAVASADGVAAAEADAPVTGGGFVVAMGMLLLFSLALPVLVVFGSMPSGLISGLIIGIGMHQAWRMTGPPEVRIQGPYQLAPAAAVADTAAR